VILNQFMIMFENRIKFYLTQKFIYTLFGIASSKTFYPSRIIYSQLSKILRRFKCPNLHLFLIISVLMHLDSCLAERMERILSDRKAPFYLKKITTGIAIVPGGFIVEEGNQVKIRIEEI